jgi:DNA repair photolyase
MSGKMLKKKSKLTAKELRIRRLKSVLGEVRQAETEVREGQLTDPYYRLKKLGDKITRILEKEQK